MHRSHRPLLPWLRWQRQAMLRTHQPDEQQEADPEVEAVDVVGQFMLISILEDPDHVRQRPTYASEDDQPLVYLTLLPSTSMRLLT